MYHNNHIPFLTINSPNQASIPAVSASTEAVIQPYLLSFLNLTDCAKDFQVFFNLSEYFGNSMIVSIE